MKLVDLNILLYAVNRDDPNHALAKRWWEQALSDDEPVGLSWVVILGFLRLVTHPRVFPRPLAPQKALDMVGRWLSQPSLRLVEPGPEHWRILREVLGPLGTAGNLITDGHLAALAIERGAVLCSTDHDFGRFAGLRWVNPLARRR